VVDRPTRSTACSAIPITSGDYLEPAAGAHVPRTPMFTWNDKPGAVTYWIAIARDASFTEIVDVALVDRPAYVPRRNYGDQETALYWAVIASPQADGSCSSATPSTLAARARSFTKVSTPPALIAPAADEDTPLQPVLRWTTTEGAAAYHVQVARDVEFRDVIDDITTGSTAYAASATYPVDTQLFWRVRAKVCRDACTKLLELRGSDVGDLRSFRRTLPVPMLDSSNATAGETIPVVSWQPVPGAIAYDVHVDQSDGTPRDFTVRAPRFSPITWYGTGVWTWRVRAVFPSLSSLVKAQSAWSAPMPYVRRITPPGDPRVSFGPRRVALAWAPDVAADKYRVEISDSDSFTRVLDRVLTPNTSFAPSMTRNAYSEGGRLFWRLAVVDAGRNVGAWRTGAFNLPRGLRVNVRGILYRGRRSVMRVRVTHRNRAVGGITVRASGPGISVRRKTNKRGEVRLRVRARRGGRVKFVASKKGYRTGSATVVVLGS
jgi:hypothetical protein